MQMLDIARALVNFFNNIDTLCQCYKNSSLITHWTDKVELLAPNLYKKDQKTAYLCCVKLTK